MAALTYSTSGIYRLFANVLVNVTKHPANVVPLIGHLVVLQLDVPEIPIAAIVIVGAATVILAKNHVLHHYFVINKKCDYRDSDISNVQNVLSARECAAQCNKTLRCTHAAYNGKNKKCYLKHANSKEQIQQTRFDRNNAWCIYYNGEDRFEAAVRTTTVQPKNTTTQDTVPKNFVINKKCDYRDSDISNLENILSARECAAECNKTTRNAWCIYYDGEDRFEAAVTTTTVQTKGTTTTVQPESTTTEDPVPKYFVINESCDYRGSDISNLQNVSSAGECVAQCYKNLNCTHITYNGNNKICFLKHADSKQKILEKRYDSFNAWCAYYNREDRFGAAAATTTIQPEITTTQDTASKNFSIYEKCGYRGSDMSKFENISSADGCAAQCLKTLRCTHATYVIKNKKCYLKHANSKELIQKTRYDYNNGTCILYNGEDRFEAAVAITTIRPKTTTVESSVSKNFVVNENCDYFGNNLSIFQATSVGECTAQCNATWNCTHLTYNGYNKICFLKRGLSKQKILENQTPAEYTWCAYYKGDDRASRQ
uniref:Apple domain-containing protein n=1 Tax=Romanomermis culicivorax TaxID=13658 RepID=A0A915L899_ROMCU